MHKSLVLTEALSIPEKINYLASNDYNNYTELSKLIFKKKFQYVVTIARGTSDCAALYASYMFAKHLGLPTYSMPPSIITLEKSKFDFTKALVIIISQSGMSEDLVQCELAAKKMGATTILISNNTESPIINNANLFYHINAGEEKSVAATKSFVLTLVIIIKIIFSCKEKIDINEHIKILGENLLLDSSNQWNYKIFDRSINIGFVVSRGVGLAISNEISLKFKELCQEMIEPFSSAEVMHGPKSLIQNSFKLLTLSIKDNSGISVNQDLKQIIKLTNMHYNISFENNDETSLFYNPYKISELDPIIILSKFYPWIVNYSLYKGLNPDMPRYLTKVTNTL